MAQSLLNRLSIYFGAGAQSLLNEADSSDIFKNTTDKGMSRERSYLDFLRHHLPSKCNIFFGGTLFDDHYAESNQVDVIITTDTVPRFDWHNKDGSGKACAHIEGTLGIVSVKSNLDKKELYNALEGIATIPATKPLNGRVPPRFSIPHYDDWPYKIVYANDGIAYSTLLDHLNEFYVKNPTIPLNRRPNVIHVAKKYLFYRAHEGMMAFNPETKVKSKLEPGAYSVFTINPDLQALIHILREMQSRTVASAQILYLYNDFFDNLNLSSASAGD